MAVSSEYFKDFMPGDGLILLFVYRKVLSTQPCCAPVLMV